MWSSCCLETGSGVTHDMSSPLSLVRCLLFFHRRLFRYQTLPLSRIDKLVDMSPASHIHCCLPLVLSKRRILYPRTIGIPYTIPLKPLSKPRLTPLIREDCSCFLNGAAFRDIALSGAMYISTAPITSSTDV